MRPELLGLLLVILLDGLKLALTLTAGEVDVGHVVVCLLDWGQGARAFAAAFPLAGLHSEQSEAEVRKRHMNDAGRHTITSFAMVVRWLHAELKQVLDSSGGVYGSQTATEPGAMTP